MPPADERRYDVIEREPFLRGWADAVQDGQITEDLGRFLARFRRILARTPTNSGTLKAYWLIRGQ